VLWILPTAIWIIRAVPARRKIGASQREALLESRPRKLDGDRLARIFVLSSQGRRVREIAAEVGVSHETVRTALNALRQAA